MCHLHNIYKGVDTLFILHVTQVTKIHVVEAEGDIKLFANSVEDTNCNVDFKDFQKGDTLTNAIVYLHRSEMKTSGKSMWRECVVSDRRRRFLVLRVFNTYSTKNEQKIVI